MVLDRLRLAAELGRWRRAGRTATLWWRDDDARAPTHELHRLLELSDVHEVPLALAVVPDSDPAALAPVLKDHPQVQTIQHGLDHQNRREGAAAGEIPPDWTREQIAERLDEGWRAMAALPGAQRVFSPPWNDVHPALPGALHKSGYLGLSAWGELSAAVQPYRVDAHIDLMRWKSGARFRGAARMRSALREELARRRRAGRWDAPIGLLTHHLAHDAAAWRYLDRFLAWSRTRPELRWVGVGELFAGKTSR